MSNPVTRLIIRIKRRYFAPKHLRPSFSRWDGDRLGQDPNYPYMVMETVLDVAAKMRMDGYPESEIRAAVDAYIKATPSSWNFQK